MNHWLNPNLQEQQGEMTVISKCVASGLAMLLLDC